VKPLYGPKDGVSLANELVEICLVPIIHREGVEMLVVNLALGL
jgi:hypothetical protein